jgi:hypothetical protein
MDTDEIILMQPDYPYAINARTLETDEIERRLADERRYLASSQRVVALLERLLEERRNARSTD